MVAGLGALAPVAAGADPAPVPVLAAAGDISCDPATVRDDGGVPQCHELDTSNLFAAAPPTAIVTLGDNQYEFARLENFQAKFEPSWGRFKPLIRSGVGNHEYAATQTADGYFDYFNGVGSQSGPAGPRTTTSETNGRYSWDLGGWHLVSLNSSCKERSSTVTVSCRNYVYGHVTTESVSWLRSDLAAHPGVCTLAYWHHPMFSSGPGDPTLETESVASTTGIREFIVGTGGRSFSQFFPQPAGGQQRGAAQHGFRCPVPHALPPPLRLGLPRRERHRLRQRNHAVPLRRPAARELHVGARHAAGRRSGHLRRLGVVGPRRRG